MVAFVAFYKDAQEEDINKLGTKTMKLLIYLLWKMLWYILFNSESNSKCSFVWERRRQWPDQYFWSSRRTFNYSTSDSRWSTEWKPFSISSKHFERNWIWTFYEADWNITQCLWWGSETFCSMWNIWYSTSLFDGNEWTSNALDRNLTNDKWMFFFSLLLLKFNLF